MYLNIFVCENAKDHIKLKRMTDSENEILRPGPTPSGKGLNTNYAELWQEAYQTGEPMHIKIKWLTYFLMFLRAKTYLNIMKHVYIIYSSSPGILVILAS